MSLCVIQLPQCFWKLALAVDCPRWLTQSNSDGWALLSQPTTFGHSFCAIHGSRTNREPRLTPRIGVFPGSHLLCWEAVVLPVLGVGLGTSKRLFPWMEVMFRSCGNQAHTVPAAATNKTEERRILDTDSRYYHKALTLLVSPLTTTQIGTISRSWLQYKYDIVLLRSHFSPCHGHVLSKCCILQTPQAWLLLGYTEGGMSPGHAPRWLSVRVCDVDMADDGCRSRRIVSKEKLGQDGA